MKKMEKIMWTMRGLTTLLGQVDLPVAVRSRSLPLAIVLTILLLIFFSVGVYYCRYTVFPRLLHRAEMDVRPSEANARIFHQIAASTIVMLLFMTVIWWRWIA